MTSNRLLVIDDEPSICAAIGRIARQSGYDVISTTDTDDCRDRIISWNPSVIVLDLSMPEMNGIELLAWLAEHHSHGCVFIFSGGDPIRLREAETMGLSFGLKIAGSLPKPIPVATLRHSLEDIYDSAGILSAHDIRQALEKDEISLVYQPQIDLIDGSLFGFEALARWNHPRHGLLPPDRFIGIVEASHIVDRFTERVLEMALAEAARWHVIPDSRIAINVSAASCASKKLPNTVQKLCSRNAISSRRVTLEVTETAAMTDPLRTGDCLRHLQAVGVDLSIDDFGTAYSSLSKLQQLPFVEIKIDKSFVSNCLTEPKSGVLVRSMIELAHSLGKRAVAEGIEDAGTLNRLREWGCDIGQGYYIGKPMSPREITVWLQQHPAESFREGFVA